MCGIVAYIGDKKASNVLIKGLKRLEYRGYDSAGICTIEDNKLVTFGIVPERAETGYGYIEAEMNNIDDKNRFAQFRTIMAYVDKNTELTAEGIVKGVISQKIKGLGGFGYDSIFYVVEKKKTFAEMTIEEKNLISHRSKAMDAIKAKLASYLNTLKSTKETA